ncbi:uncharacterized protein LOC117744821 isoform X2 [Cyclopterus lumpus]|nr:uncharacterized protein LOC117744821 isoform X2 [Cyclopterus lumpus]
MMDDEFPCDYRLTVFPFTRDVFLYVPSTTVDLSVFGGDQSTLIRSLRSAHGSLRFRSSLQHMKATVEGPFSAVQALRRDLIRRAGQLNSAEVKLRETPLNPRVISHREVVGSVNCGGSKAKPGPGSSPCLSPPTQTTGEATEVQNPLSNGKARSASPRQKVSHESLEEEPREQSGQGMPGEYRTELLRADPRQVLNAGDRASLSDLDRHLAEEVSATQPGVDGTPDECTRPDRSSAPKIRAEISTGSSSYSRTDYLEDLDQSGSAFTAQTKDVSTSSKSDVEDAEGPPATGPGEKEEGHEEDASVWVDSYTFRYIEKFDTKELDRCLRGLEARVELEGADLARISLTERQTSKTGSQVRLASEDLMTLVERWSQMLRVHRIDLDEDGPPERQTLIKICDNVNVLYVDVLYLLEDSCVKVIGPSIHGHLFCRNVEDRVARLKDPL